MLIENLNINIKTLSGIFIFIITTLIGALFGVKNYIDTKVEDRVSKEVYQVEQKLIDNRFKEFENRISIKFKSIRDQQDTQIELLKKILDNK